MSDFGGDAPDVEEVVAVEEVAVEAEAPKGKMYVVLPWSMRSQRGDMPDFNKLTFICCPCCVPDRSVEDALQDVLKRALIHDGLARGLRESAKALDRRQAHLCVLNESCTEAEYVKLIEALCAEGKINLIKVSQPFVRSDGVVREGGQY